MQHTPFPEEECHYYVENKITLQEETFKNENKVSLRVEAKTC